MPDSNQVDFADIIDELWLNNIENIRQILKLEQNQIADKSHISKLPLGGRVVRAAAIENICFCANGLDKRAIFAATNLLDHYYTKKKLQFTNVDEACLTAVVSLAVIIESNPAIPQDATKQLLDFLKRSYEWDRIALVEEDVRDCL